MKHDMSDISSKILEKLFNVRRHTLHYWRKTGIFTASDKTSGGHYRYSFQDLVALKTIKTLQESGFTTYQIRKAFASLKKRFGNIDNPFVEKPVIVIGNKIAIVDKGKVYDAMTGQMQIISIDIDKLNVSSIYSEEDISKEATIKKTHSSKKSLNRGMK